MNGPARSFDVEVFFDGDCPLCTREIAMLRRLDRRHRIVFTDIAAPGFDAVTLGKTHAELMDRIHGRLADGTWIEGVEVFRRLYGAVGFGALVPLTRLPGIRHVLDWGYERFAKNRLKWTGRCAPDGAAASIIRTATARTPWARSDRRSISPGPGRDGVRPSSQIAGGRRSLAAASERVRRAAQRRERS